MWGVQPNDGVAIEGSINDSRGNEWNDDDFNFGDDSTGFFFSRCFCPIHFVCLDDCDSLIMGASVWTVGVWKDSLIASASLSSER